MKKILFILTVLILNSIGNIFGQKKCVIRQGEIEFVISDTIIYENKYNYKFERIEKIEKKIEQPVFSKENLLNSIFKKIYCTCRNQNVEIISFNLSLQGDKTKTKYENQYNSNIINSNDTTKILEFFKLNKRTLIYFDKLKTKNNLFIPPFVLLFNN